ncbi:MAG TPA: deoxynucleoside kinase [Gammaproteobacteria bacterium]|nr:deoxynucleoside kinase [Gammaproteobacteria bacterium]
MNEPTGKYIVVEGPVGVGKTTLAQRLARSLNSDLLLETPEENPFLSRFYEQPRQYALPTQLFFLFQRARQIQSMQQADLFAPVRISDFLLDKDRLFAELTLTPEELNLYNQVHQHLAVEAPTPDLVIYLQAPAHVLLQRIARRGLAFERRISEDYLNRLVEAYVRFFHRYDAAPLLIVNATEIDLANDEADYAALLERVRQAPPGRQYVNLRY